MLHLANCYSKKAKCGIISSKMLFKFCYPNIYNFIKGLQTINAMTTHEVLKSNMNFHYQTIDYFKCRLNNLGWYIFYWK